MTPKRFRNTPQMPNESGRQSNAALAVLRWLRRNPEHSVPVAMLTLYLGVWLTVPHHKLHTVPALPPPVLVVTPAPPVAPPEPVKAQSGERLDAARFVSVGNDQWRIEIWKAGEELGVEDYINFYRNGHLVRQVNAETLGGTTLGFGEAKFATRFPVLVIQVEPTCGTPTITQIYTIRRRKLIDMGQIGALNGGPIFHDYDGDGKPEWVFDDYDWYTYYGKAPKHFLIYKERADACLLAATVRVEHDAATPARQGCGCADETLQSVAWRQDKAPNVNGVLNLQGDIARIHDPAITREGNVYYTFSTGPGIRVTTSSDKLTWKRQGQVFAKPPDWTQATIPGSNAAFWAPDISYWRGKWHLYYAVSTFGSNHSAIGLATNTTLNPAKANYQWKDEGAVIVSKRGDGWNAIDPNLIVDAKKRVWLTFGSFWGGIKMVELNPKTGIPDKPDAPPISLAARPEPGAGHGAIEAPFLIRHAKYYYLFVSFDFCCRGAKSTYNVRVGRSAAITGPYKDKTGKAMRDGGGTLVVAGNGRWRGTGHNAVLQEKNADWLVYHAYDAEDGGVSKLRIERMAWDADGWPLALSMTAPQTR
ncbi:uncharacterized protein KY384_000072 [Bacidia gigantensis]|uniref:uncharacterized protein n=1 Tax=Bacidia gigantensis TaxID=2732470 RepID=UPI001D03E0D5|nr:uncharacterized protein KY384_000072 [Bacidia gigantensis]KAG8526080.1 hypothetical protein KY384_000072 [Bacidia gigantensis]